MTKSNTNKKIRFRPVHAYLTIFSFTLLMLSFLLNIFGLDSFTFFNFQKDSESLITNKIGCEHQHGKDIFGGMLVYIKEGTTQDQLVNGYKNCSTNVFAAYIPQVGIQGQLISFFAPNGNVKHYYWLIKLITTSAFAALLTAFILKVRQEFSLITALTTLGFLLISNWLVYMARNLYWVPALIFLPFIFSFVAFPWFKQRKKLLQFYAILGFTFFLKCLIGYEFLSNIILSAFAPIIFYEVQEHRSIPFLSLIKHLVKVCLVGLIGFLIAVGLNIFELSFYTHSLRAAFDAVRERALERSSGGPTDSVLGNLVLQSKAIQPKVFAFLDKALHINGLSPQNSNFFYEKGFIFSVLAFGFLGMITLPIVFNSPIDIIVQSVFFSIATLLVITFIWYKQNLLKTSPKHFALILASFWALLSSVSWFVLAHPHIINHLHLDGIIFYIPFALVFYIVLGVFTDQVLKKLLPGLRG